MFEVIQLPNTKTIATTATTTVDFTLLLEVIWLPTQERSTMLITLRTTASCGLDV